MSIESTKIHIHRTIGWVRWVAVAGLAVSLYLLVLHYRYDVLGATCNIGSIFSCSVLLIKKYSMWLGIPVPVYSILLYMISLGLAQRVYRVRDVSQYRPYLYLFFLAAISFAATLGMAYIAFVKLSTICLFCSLLYLISIVYLILMFRVFATDVQPWWYFASLELKSGWKRPIVWQLTFACLIILVGSRLVMEEPEVPLDFDPQTASLGRSIGNPESEVLVEVFSDFQCPACKSAKPFLYQIEQNFSGKVLITYRYYPLDPTCNDRIRRSLHPQACKAARASFCASIQQKFWQYHDQLFENQQSLRDGLYRDLALSLNLNMEEFDACMLRPESMDMVRNDVALGNDYRVRATPTFVINGQPYEGRRTIEDFANAIEGL